MTTTACPSAGEAWHDGGLERGPQGHNAWELGNGACPRRWSSSWLAGTLSIVASAVRPEEIVKQAENLGEVLHGAVIQNSPYDIYMGKSEFRIACRVKLERGHRVSLAQRVRQDYRVHMIMVRDSFFSAFVVIALRVVAVACCCCCWRIRIRLRCRAALSTAVGFSPMRLLA